VAGTVQRTPSPVNDHRVIAEGRHVRGQVNDDAIVNPCLTRHQCRIKPATRNGLDVQLFAQFAEDSLFQSFTTPPSNTIVRSSALSVPPVRAESTFSDDAF
jgi:hypothetical protein